MRVFSVLLLVLALLAVAQRPVNATNPDGVGISPDCWGSTDPAFPQYGTIGTCTHVTDGEYCTYSCQDGYKLSGGALFCSNGLLQGAQVCTPSTCARWSALGTNPDVDSSNQPVGTYTYYTASGSEITGTDPVPVYSVATLTCADPNYSPYPSTNVLCIPPMSGSDEAAWNSTTASYCRLTYRWVSSWGPCSRACNSGRQSNTITCLASNGQTVDNSFCQWAVNAQPESERTCNTNLCPLCPGLASGATGSNVIRSGTNYLTGSSITFSCPDGYTLAGSAGVTCVDYLDSGNNAQTAWTVTPTNDPLNFVALVNPTATCVASECPSLPTLDNGQWLSTATTFTTGQTVSAKCNSGFTLSGPSTITCLGEAGQTTSNWNAIPTCVVLKCPRLVDANGYWTYITSQDLDQFASLTCNQFYHPSIEGTVVNGVTLTADDATTNCVVSTGSIAPTWDRANDLPYCVPNPCVLDPPANGLRGTCSNSQASGSMCSFACKSGFQLTGPTQLTCLAGRYNDVQSCQPKICPPLTVEHGYWDHPQDTSTGSYATLTCDTNYTPSQIQYSCVGSSVSQDAVWSGAQPTCLPNNCRAYKAPLNGDIGDCQDVLSGNTCSARCNDGYSIYPPNSVRTCTAELFDIQQQCVPSYCDPRPTLSTTHGTWTYGNYIGDVKGAGSSYTSNPPVTATGWAQLNCEAGYTVKPDGLGTIGCKAVGGSQQAEWNPNRVAPYCEPNSCPLTAPANGALNLCPATLAHGASCSFGCNTGYQISSSVPQTCFAGVIQNPQTCVPKSCSLWVPPTNGGLGTCGGVLAGGPIKSGETCAVSCDPGYQLSGPATLLCTNGVFSETSTCVPQSCVNDVSLPNGIKDTHGTWSTPVITGQVSSLTCEPGYGVYGASTIRCDPVAGSIYPEFNPDDVANRGQCKPLPCPELFDLHGTWIYEGSLDATGHSASLNCNIGFHLADQSLNPVNCIANGAGNPPIWDRAITTCVPDTCSLNKPDHGDWGTCTATLDSDVTCSFTCEPGYYLSYPSITCDANQASSPAGALTPVQECLPSTCPVLKEAFGKWSYETDPAPPITTGTTWTLTCNDGYHITGAVDTKKTDTYSCTASSSLQAVWDVTKARPTCTVSACPVLTDPATAFGIYASWTTANTGETAYLTCPPNHTPSAPFYNCIADAGTSLAKWDGPQPTCLPDRCHANPLRAPAHGNIGTCGDVASGDSCSAACNDGYTIDPPGSVRNCYAALFDKAQKCVPSQCSAQPADPNGGTWTYGNYVGDYKGVGLESVATAKPVVGTGWAQLTCPTGWTARPDGLSTIACVAIAGSTGAQWNPKRPNPYCTPDSCRVYPPTNGNMGLCPYWISSGDSCALKCNEGYTPSTSLPISCFASVISNKPTCLPNSCIAYVAPTNGGLGTCGGDGMAVGGVPSGSTCAFTCSPGYKLTGPATMTCTAGKFSARPTCEPIMCQDTDLPAAYLAADANAQLSTYTSSITSSYWTTGKYTGQFSFLVCPNGYGVFGAGSIQCVPGAPDSTGNPTVQWASTSTGVCKPLACPSLADAQGGTWEYKTLDATGHYAVLTCPTGYVKSPSTVPLPNYQGNPICIVDSATGENKWSTTIQQCAPQSCAVPAIANGGAGNCPSYLVVGNSCSYSCDVGYTPSYTSLTCFSSNATLSATPTCVKSLCPVLSEPHGTWSRSLINDGRYQLGESAVLTCEDGYHIAQIPAPFSKVSADYACVASAGNAAIWDPSRPRPTCEVSWCSQLTDPASKGGVNAYWTSAYTGTVATLTCPPNYTPSATSYACIASPNSPDAVWIGPTQPTCLPDRCKAWRIPAFGSIGTCGDVADGATCSIACQAGYSVSPAGSVRTCHAAEFDLYQTCVPNRCPALPAVVTGAIANPWKYGNYDCDWKGEGSNYGTPNFPLTSTGWAQLTCAAGYTVKPDGLSTIACVAKAGAEQPVWNPKRPLPYCEPNGCTLTPPVNGNYGLCGTTLASGSMCSFNCNPGYTLSFSTQTTCNAGVLSNVPTCVPNRCYATVAPLNGQIGACADVASADSCTFTCNPGFFIDPAVPTMTCTTGKFSTRPTCKAALCTATITDPVGGTWTTNVPAGASSTLTCPPGYGVVGTNKVPCTGTAGASPASATYLPADISAKGVCTALACPLLTDNYGTWTYENGKDATGNTATLTCKPGYDVSGGQNVVTCTGVVGQTTPVWQPSAIPVCTPRSCTIAAITGSVASGNTCGNTASGSVTIASGSSCSIACDTTQYFLSSTQSMTCLAGVIKYAQTCVPKGCTGTAPTNGFIGTCSNVQSGSTCSLSCDVANGYNLHGDASLTCNKGALSGNQYCEIDYTWTPTVWSACSKKCGSGLRTRSFTCDGSDRTVRNNEQLCLNQGEVKPTSTSQECNTQACDLTSITTSPSNIVTPAYDPTVLSYSVDGTATTQITFTFTKTSSSSTISVFNHLESTSWSTLAAGVDTYVLNRVGASTVQTIYFLDSFDNTYSYQVTWA